MKPSQILGVLGRLQGVVPQNAMDLIKTQATAVAGAGSQGLGLAFIIGLLVALYSASKGMASLMQGLNIAYDEEEERGFFFLKVETVLLTLALIVGVLVASIAALAVPAAIALFPIGALARIGGMIGIAVILIAMTILGLSLVYRVGPSRDSAQWKWVSPGAITACALWLVASAGFSYYVANFGSYNTSFGTLGGVIVLLMWFWISAYVILLGAELNAEMEAQTRRDTTVGEPDPMGQRGAVKADKLGTARQSES